VLLRIFFVILYEWPEDDQNTL